MVTPSVAMTTAMGDEPDENQYLKLASGSGWQSEVVLSNLQAGSSGMGETSLPSSPMQAIAPSPICMQNENLSERAAAWRVAPYLVWWQGSSGLSDSPLSLMCAASSSVSG